MYHIKMIFKPLRSQAGLKLRLSTQYTIVSVMPTRNKIVMTTTTLKIYILMIVMRENDVP